MKDLSRQTVESLMEAYDNEYNSQKPNRKPASSIQIREVDENTKDPRVELTQQMFVEQSITIREYFDRSDFSKPEYFAFKTDKSTGKRRILEYTLGDIDAKFPRNEWIQMLLDKGVTIEVYEDYEEYLNIRQCLFSQLYLCPEGSEEFDQSAYIDKEIQQYQLIQEARCNNPDVENWSVIGENALPSVAGRMYVCKTESGYEIKSSKTQNSEPKLSEEQQTKLQNEGIEPEGWEVVYIDEKGNML
ncbi:MAG: hypothetical protein OXD54_17790 [Candidatus Poribacteria bacterium]|nr:hypothetical protein [Candidatus Poribacteria bacterium]